MTAWFGTFHYPFGVKDVKPNINQGKLYLSPGLAIYVSPTPRDYWPHRPHLSPAPKINNTHFEEHFPSQKDRFRMEVVQA